MTGALPLVIPATLQLPELDIELTVEVDFHRIDSTVCIEAVRVAGAPLELEQAKLEELADMILTLY